MTGSVDVEADELRSLPKVELHVHLEGSITAETAVTLARRHGQDPADVLPLENGGYPARFRDFDQFVRTYLAVSRQLREPEDLRTVARAFARAQADQGVAYTEVTFTAKTHVDNGIPADEMWAAVTEGLVSVAGTQVRLIVDAVRNLGPAHGAATVELVAEAGAPIVGLGLAGDENAAPAGEFRMLREAADELGLGLAVHAGETGPARNVWQALDDLGADRIGHGVAAATEQALLDRLAAEATPVEVCPTSNVVLGVFEELAAHPLPRLYAAGLNVSINSDDPPYFNTTLTQELLVAARLLDLDAAGLAELQRGAARAAFAPHAQRAKLVAAIDAWERGRG
ncbi:MAG TPA: adenosine deaminase [Nitriliruptorales bacterium]